MARGLKGDFAVLGFVTVTQAHFGFYQCWRTEGRFSEGALGLCEPVTRRSASFQAKSEGMADKKVEMDVQRRESVMQTPPVYCGYKSVCIFWLQGSVLG